MNRLLAARIISLSTVYADRYAKNGSLALKSDFATQSRAEPDPHVQKPSLSIRVALPDPVCGVANKNILPGTSQQIGGLRIASLLIGSAKNLLDNQPTQAVANKGDRAFSKLGLIQ